MTDITITLSAAEAKAVLEARRELDYTDADLAAVCRKIEAAQKEAVERALVTAVAAQPPMLLLVGEGL